MTRISIITPVLNGARFMEACIKNVIEQRVDGLEHVIIDSASTDGTVRIIADYAQRFPHIRFVSEGDNGQSDAMNKGVRIATADIIGMLNVDDFYQPGAVNDGLEFLEKHPATDFVTGDCNVLTEGDVLHFVNHPSDLRLETLLLGWRYAEHPVNPSAYFYRKKIHDLVGEYILSETFAMDVCFIYECAAKVRMTYHPKLWGNFRVIPGAKTAINRDRASDMLHKIRSDRIAALPLRRRIKMRAIWAGMSARKLYQRIGKPFGV